MTWVKCGYVPAWAQKHWRLIRPVNLRTLKQDGYWYACSHWLGICGSATSKSEAIEMAMAELFEVLEFYGGNPKPNLAEHLESEYARMLTYAEIRELKPAKK